MFRDNILYLFVIPINTQEAGIVGLHKCKYSDKQTNTLFIGLTERLVKAWRLKISLRG